MYIRYMDKKETEFGIWKISDDLTSQVCVLYNENGEYSPPVDEKWIPLDKALDIDWAGGHDSVIDILTQDQVDEAIFFLL